ncbi:MAG: hypothetical protein DI626_09495 [Micavibrio aeruginosavorus]|uniref:Uncharacterized protein n=1 Tax=Micavibrio aeruginosavorus TaxID=349221 RepID=A0A2W5BIV6_9BACT|nr:MAG: hypothetical protein DI626_09495 [Micavibrio aeruginosavorus]
MTQLQKHQNLGSEIRSISTVFTTGAYGDRNKWAGYAYGRRESDGRRVRCKWNWDHATGITTISSYGEKSEFTKEEWSVISNARNEYDQKKASNAILDARKTQPKP